MDALMAEQQRKLARIYGLAVFQMASRDVSPRLQRLVNLARTQLQSQSGKARPEFQHVFMRAQNWPGMVRWTDQAPEAAKRRLAMEGEIKEAEAKAGALRKQADQIVAKAWEKVHADGWEAVIGVLRNAESSTRSMAEIAQMLGDVADWWPIPDSVPIARSEDADADRPEQLDDATLAGKLATALGLSE
ncbi:MAG TPA: hypothetical protein PKC43_06635 [Phycisphaerales bacterium]|nr:hypothetical protein [Phycisphaerales bacterium]HMP37108.1 hypothetical protein [Phycisphaerales bacterium]